MKTFTLEDIARMTSNAVAVRLEEQFFASVLGEVILSQTTYEEVGDSIINKSVGRCKCSSDRNERFVQVRLEFSSVEEVEIICKLAFSTERIFQLVLSCSGVNHDFPILIDPRGEKERHGHFYQEVKGSDYFALSYTPTQADNMSPFIIDFSK